MAPLDEFLFFLNTVLSHYLKCACGKLSHVSIDKLFLHLFAAFRLFGVFGKLAALQMKTRLKGEFLKMYFMSSK